MDNLKELSSSQLRSVNGGATTTGLRLGLGALILIVDAAYYFFSAGAEATDERANEILKEKGY